MNIQLLPRWWEMVDIVDSEKRSRMMSGIRGKDTRPEVWIRKALHRRGFRFRLHDKTLPGKPDLVFPRYRAVIQVQGCFWHRHDCHLFKWPSTRSEFWRKKILGNVERDKATQEQLQKLGWKILVIWECALKGKEKLPQQEVIRTIEAWLINDPMDASVRGRPKP